MRKLLAGTVVLAAMGGTTLSADAHGDINIPTGDTYAPPYKQELTVRPNPPVVGRAYYRRSHSDNPLTAR